MSALHAADRIRNHVLSAKSGSGTLADRDQLIDDVRLLESEEFTKGSVSDILERLMDRSRAITDPDLVERLDQIYFLYMLVR